MIKDQLMGSWKLVEYTMQVEGDSKTIHPFGEHPIGTLTYTDKHVSVHIMRSDREKCSDQTTAKIERADNYAGYFGTYEVKGDEVIHTPSICNYSELIGVAMARNFKLSEKSLLISCKEYNAQFQKIATSELVWEKITS